MKYLFLILTGWVSFLMTDCSTPQEKGKEERELWNFYADFATDEVLAINGQLFGNCIPAGDNVGFTKTTRVFYSKNDGKFIPMTVESFGKGKKEYSWELSAFFSAKPHEKYTLITEYAVGNIRCKNPDGTKQEFTHVGYDSLIVPTTQLYGTYSHVFSPASQENIIGIYTDTRTKESIAIIRSDKVWHILYKPSKSVNYTEMEITKNPANASFVAVFPNDKSKKYKIKYLDLWGYHGSQYVWVKNPDGTTQTFGYDEATRSVLESHYGLAAQVLNHLLGK